MEEALFGDKKTIKESREIELDSDMSLISITDKEGNIEYCSDEFVKISGFDTISLVGSQHTLMRHEDMPSTLFKYIWSRLEAEQELSAIIKNNHKSGDFYWTVSSFVIRRDDEGKVIGYRANRKPAPKQAVESVSAFYEKLIYLENISGNELAMNFFNDFFTRRNTNYDDFISKYCSTSNKESDTAKKKRFSRVRNILKKK